MATADSDLQIQLAPGAPMAAYQEYIHRLEKMHGWLDVDLVHNCFLMGEEVGELFKAVRRFERYYEQEPTSGTAGGRAPGQLGGQPTIGGEIATDPNAAAEATAADTAKKRAELGDELVDVMNYLMAIANRAQVDLEAAFRRKNARNQRRRWKS